MINCRRPIGLFLGSTALLTLPVLAHAAAIERAVPSPVRVLFEEGSYAEFGVVYTDPDQSGEGANLTALGVPITVPGNTGDLFESNWNFSGAWKADITDRLSYTLGFDEPYGADTNYGPGTFNPAVFTYQGTRAELNTYQFSGVLAYDATPNIKIYGGVRAQALDANAAIPFIQDYSVDAGQDWGFGWLAGAAYHRPDIMLRVALTYSSAVNHSLSTDEFSSVTGSDNTETDVDTPQSATLEFQSGVAPKTLVFGSIRWVDWSEFSIAPPDYVAITGRPLVDYTDDWWTYTLGVGRQFTDNLAGSLSVAYEPSVDAVLTTLGPYDGRTTATAALSYDFGQANVTGGLTYGKLGDTTNILETDFNDGSVWGAGLRVSYSF